MNSYRIQIGDLHLTDDGTADGLPYKLSVSNVEDLTTEIIGQNSVTASGAVVSTFSTWTKGKFFEIEIKILYQNLYNDLKNLVIDALENNTEFEIIGTGGAAGDFTVNAKPNPQKPYQFERVKNDRLYNCVFRFITQRRPA